MKMQNWLTFHLKSDAYSTGDWHRPSALFRGSKSFLCSVLDVAIFAFVLTAGELGAQEATVSEVTALRPIDGAAEDEFGYSIAVGGDTMAVGARGSGGTGAVFVYRRNEGGSDQWVLSATIVPDDAAEGDRFGQAIALRGETMAVGAPGDDDVNLTTAPGSTELFASGSVYIFERDSAMGQWAQTSKLVAGDGVPFDNFGYTLSLSGDVLAVAAWTEDEFAGGATVGSGSARAGNDSGSAYILERNPATGTWSEITKIDSPRMPVTSDEAFFDNFAKTIAIDGDTLIVGASEEEASDADQGTVYVFERNAGGPATVPRLTASGPPQLSAGTLLWLAQPGMTTLARARVPPLSSSDGTVNGWKRPS